MTSNSLSDALKIDNIYITSDSVSIPENFLKISAIRLRNNFFIVDLQCTNKLIHYDRY